MAEKSYRHVDGKAKWVIVEKGKITNRNPTKEELSKLKVEPSETRTTNCDRCGEPFGRQRNREYISGKWTKKWICDNCYKKDSRLANRRIGTIDPSSSSAKGDYYESVTCKVRPVDNLNILENNYCVPIDHSRDHELGIIESKGRLYNYDYDKWIFASLDRLWGKQFDNAIFYCSCDVIENIVRIYIIPKFEILKRTSITIYRYLNNPRISNIGWYEKYRVDVNSWLKGDIKYIT